MIRPDDPVIQRLEAMIRLCLSGLGANTPATTGTFAYVPGVTLRSVVALVGEGTVGLASASGPTTFSIGMVTSINGAIANVTYWGEVGGFVGLVPGARYFLGVTPGTVTATAPRTPGQIVQVVGAAKSSTVLVIGIEENFSLL